MTIRTAGPSLLLASLLVACGGPTEPSVPFSLTIDGPAASVGVWVQPREFWFLSCAASLTAEATGDGSAVWVSGEVRVLDPTHGVIRFELGAADLVDIWGTSRIDGGESLSGAFVGRATDEYQQTTTLRYALESGEVRSVSHTSTCRAP